MKKGEIIKVAKTDEITGDCSYLYFKRWSKDDKDRVYINDYHRRTIGYIDLMTCDNETIIYDTMGNTDEELKRAIDGFFAIIKANDKENDILI